MNIDGLKVLLSSYDMAAQVNFDFCGYAPDGIDSWRGIYAEPALGYAKRVVHVGELLTELAQATDGRTYTGWKGGEYRYNDFSQLHVDNPGECSNTEIVDVLFVDGVVILSTERGEG